MSIVAKRLDGQNGTWHGGGPRSRPHCARWRPSAPPQKGGGAPQFLAHVYCEGWWRWALVTPDGVAPSQMVGVFASVNLPLHHKVQKFSCGTSSPGWSRKKGRKTVVVVYCGQTAGWIKMLLSTEVGLGPNDIVLRGDPAPPKRGATPNFRPMSIVATVAHLSYCWALIFVTTNHVGGILNICMSADELWNNWIIVDVENLHLQ